jgi:hypothetical protein
MGLLLPDALFFNGYPDDLLEEIAQVHTVQPDLPLYLQPAGSGVIRDLSIVSISSPIPMFASISTDLKNVHYGGHVVFWEDKTNLDDSRRRDVETTLNQEQPKQGGLTNLSTVPGKSSINLIQVIGLVRVPPFPIRELHLWTGEPLRKPPRGGGWRSLKRVRFERLERLIEAFSFKA